MFITLSILAELFFVAILILLFFRLKNRFGYAPLYVLLGSNQYLQTILVSTVRVKLFWGLSISPGPSILFSSGLFAILLMYIKEGVKNTQRLILAIVLANLSFTIISLITNEQEVATNGIASGLFMTNFRVFVVGTLTLIMDAFLLVIIYEFLFINIRWLNLYSRLVLALLITLNFDALLFVMGSFWDHPNVLTILLGQLIGKSVAAIFFGTSLFFYLRYFDNDTSELMLTGKKGKEDIFSILTYKGRYEKLKTEKATSDEQLKKAIDDKAIELENSVRRFTILSGIRELRIDKFSFSEQAYEILRKVKEAFEVDACTIHLIKDTNLELYASVGIPDNEKEKVLPLTVHYLNEIIVNKKSLAIEDVRTDKKYAINNELRNTAFQYISCLGSPMLYGKDVIGILKIYVVSGKRLFTNLEKEHIQMVANQIAYSRENVTLFEQNEKHKEILVKQIVARKKVEEAIKESEEKYRNLIERASDAIMVYQVDGTIISCNQTAYKLSGYSEVELQQLLLKDLFFEEDLKEYPIQLGAIRAGKTTIDSRKIKCKDGSSIDIELNSRLMPDGTIMVVARDLTERIKTQKQIVEYNEQLRDLAAHLLSIREEERRRIGREIHDDLGQQLTAVKMDVAWIDKKMPEENVLVKDKLKNIIGLLDDSNLSVRRILNELKPSILDEYGLIDAIEWHSKQFTETTGIPVILNTDEPEIRLEEEMATCIFRVCQEALTNVARHAEAKKVIISLKIIEDRIVVKVTDDGKGFVVATAKNKGSFGLLGMHERVRSLTGILQIDSSINKGTTIMISLPYNNHKINP